MAKSSSRRQHFRISLREDVVRNTSSLRVDRDAGVIHGVKVLGLESANGRRYTPEAVRQAARLYEGVPVNIDHPSDGQGAAARECDARFGQLRNVQVRADGLYADLHYLKAHPLAERICEAAERMPDAFGLSHNAEGRGEQEDGVLVIREIADVHSVDLVSDPATTQGLFEHRTTMKTTLRKLIEASKVQQALRQRLLEMGGDDELMQAEMDAPAPAEAGDWKQDLVAAIAKLVGSEDEADHKMAQKIMAMLKPAAAEVPEEDDGKEKEKDLEEEHEGKDDKDKKAEEGRQGRTQTDPTILALKEELEAMKLAEWVRGECERLDVPCDRALVEGLQAMRDRAKITRHLEYLKKLRVAAGTTQGARSQERRTVTEGRQEAGKPAAKSAEELFEAICG